MSNHTTNCFLCDKKVSYAGKNKHLFSHSHSQEIQDAIIFNKRSFLPWINDTNKRNIRIPSITLKGHQSKICFPCKKIHNVSYEYINCPCGKTAENAEIIKSILDASIHTHTPLTQSLEAPSQPPLTQSQDTSKLEKENADLMRKVKMLECRVAVLEETEEAHDALISVIQTLEQKHPLALNVAMILLKKNHRSLYDGINGDSAGYLEETWHDDEDE